MHSKNAKSAIIFYFLDFSLNFTQMPCPKYFQTSKYILIECGMIQFDLTGYTWGKEALVRRWNKNHLIYLFNHLVFLPSTTYAILDQL